MDLLDRARKSLNKSVNDNVSIRAQSYALDSIAASLLHIAENMQPSQTVINNDHKIDADAVELLVRRLLDDAKAPTVKTPKVKK